MMMKRTTSILLVILLGGLLLTSTAQTFSLEGYNLSWWTVDGGGRMRSIEDGYSLSGTIGQPDAGLLASGDYSLGGGFWAPGVVTGEMHRVYLPVVLRQSP
jgi:hypothetical protein